MTSCRKIFGQNERVRLNRAVQAFGNQRQLAECVGIRASAIGAILSGAKEPTANQLGMLYEILGLQFGDAVESSETQMLWMREQLLNLTGQVSAIARCLEERNVIAATVEQSSNMLALILVKIERGFAKGKRS